jgi:hypothetical protein
MWGSCTMGRSGSLAWRNVRCRGSQPLILAGKGCALRCPFGPVGMEVDIIEGCAGLGAIRIMYNSKVERSRGR